MKTVVPKLNDVDQKWYVLDGKNEILGRLASQTATLLRGKHKPEFTPHLDFGDHVIIVNASQIKVTGNKMSKKVYTKYTGYPGGLRTVVLEKLFKERPERVINKAVKGMLPKNKLGRKMIGKLHVYAGPEHPHQAQKPEDLPKSLRRI